MSDFTEDPAWAGFRVANGIAALGEDMGVLPHPPAGEVLWQEDSNTVTLTPDGWLVLTNAGKAALYGCRVRATPGLLVVLRRL